MFDYLQKYQQVPEAIRAKLDAPIIKTAIQRLENNYHISLASILIKVIVKDIPLSRLSAYLGDNSGLTAEQAKSLAVELQVQVLSTIQDYLAKPLAAPININQLAKSQTTVALPTNQPATVQPISLESILNKLVSQQNYFKQPAELSRWRQAAHTFLIGVRNQKALIDFLTRPVAGGGLGISSDQASCLEQQLLEARELLHQQARQQITVQTPTKPTDKLIAQSVVRDFESDLLANLRKIDNQPRLELDTETELPAAPETATKLLPETTLAAPANLPVDQPTETIIESPQPSPESTNLPLPKEEPQLPTLQPTPTINNQPNTPTIVIPIDQRATDNKTGKIRMDDVRFTPKTLTPIDELANLNLKRFRYLGNGPSERAKKIKEKIDLLAEYGYSKRLQGISAWRQSPLNLLYLQVGQTSIEQGIPAKQQLDNLSHQDPEGLTFDEFVAIMNLNQQIRF